MIETTRTSGWARRAGMLGGVFLAAALALACLCAQPGAKAHAAQPGLQAIGLQATDYDISWYEGKSSPYAIANVKQLKGLAYLVNSGADTFEGKEVDLKPASNQIVFVEGMSIEPIGDADHPFEGTFDGGGTSISNPTVAVGDRLSNVGLFGYAGKHATIKNLSLRGSEDCSITVANEEDGKTIANVGAIAGYLGGSLENCYSSVDVYITNNGAVPDKKGEKAEELCTIIGIGGLVGSLGGDMIDCRHADGELHIDSKSNVTENVPYIGVFIGGLAGVQGDVSDATHIPRTSGCENTGPLYFNVSGSGSLDRFNQPMYSKCTMVGGIVGYAMGNVADCKNSADIDSGRTYEADVYSTSNGESKLVHAKGDYISGYGASTTGGIVGSLRGPTIVESTAATGVVGSDSSDPGYDVWLQSKGAKKADVIAVERCQNTAHVVGLASVGGICGSTGAFTQVVACANSGQIDGTRWNKPCPAGIVGISNGDIVYCSSTGRIATTDGGGFYASGITGLLTTYNTVTTPVDLVLEAAEIYGCYITGNIVSNKEQNGYRAAVIAGENDGYIHDNCFLPNLTVSKAVDEDVFGDSEYHSRLVSEGENRGTLSNNHELSPEDLRASKGIALLNRVTSVNGAWDNYYVANPNKAGYPLLNWQAPGEATAGTDINDAVSADGVSLVGNPAYSAAISPVPEIAITAKDGTTLYQGADYRVVPQTDARAVSAGKPYTATIVGLNGYSGTLERTVAYGIDKCDIGACKVLAGSKVFNWEAQEPAWVKVVDDAGNEVSSDDYTWERVDCDPDNVKRDSQGKYHDYTNVHNASYKYDIKVTAKDSSESYTGSTVQAAFHIEWAMLLYEGSDPAASGHGCSFDKVVWGDQEWNFADAIATKGFVKITYTGSPITPTVANPAYMGRTLRDGTGKAYYNAPLDYDFRYVYGNANAETTEATGVDCVNVTGSDEAGLACMTIRYTAGGNFTNFTNVFFEIVPASVSDDVEISGIDSSYAYTGAAIAPKPTLTYNGMTLVEGTDYSLQYKDNVDGDTATVVITGLGNYGDTVEKTFTITGAPHSEDPDEASQASEPSDAGQAPAAAKASQVITAKNKTVKLKAKKLKKKALKIKIAKVAQVSAQTQVTYTGKANKKKAKFKVSKKGVITVKKGTPKGKYKVKITATAAADDRYEAAPAKKFTITVKVV